MNSPDWTEVGRNFDELVGKTPGEREHQLNQIHVKNPRLAEELFSLLKAHELAEGFIEKKVQKVLNTLTPIVDLEPKEKVLHFEIVQLLGAGSLAKVYLAKDTELGRYVALKVTLSHNREARTLANFSSDGIVQVHSEHVIEREGELLRILCIQYIAGPTLAELQRELKVNPKQPLVQILDQFPQEKVTLDHKSLKWREQLSSISNPEAIILLGARLAEILGHAHALGVLHLDIKPANILIDPYGQPFLSDFNVSSDSQQEDKQSFGGTPYFMAPEQADLFRNANADIQLDGRADIYALGKVLRDLLVALNFSDSKIEAILSHATEPNRDDRIGSAIELANELKAWVNGSLAEKELPKYWPGLGWVSSHPMLALVTLTVLSQLAASVINITYNRLQIMSNLSPQQNEVFLHFVGIYNAITYPVTILVCIFFMRALFRKDPKPEDARRAALNIPLILFVSISFGWLPGAYIFPHFIDAMAGPIPDYIFWQFAGSFFLAWLNSMTTTLAVSTFVIARALYPKYWPGQPELAVTELKALERINRSLTFVAALVPMCGVLFVVLLAPPQISNQQAFKILLLVIVGCGLTNLLVVQRLSRYVEPVLAALKNKKI